MTTAIARKTLNRARLELHRAKGVEDLRQAAEKAWRAAREAVYAVLDAAGERPEASTLGHTTVSSLEARLLRRPRGRPQPLADGYLVGLQLHGPCFYDGECPTKAELEGTFDRVEALIEQAENDVYALDHGPKRRR